MADTTDLQQFEALPIEEQIKRFINASDAEFSRLNNQESGLKYRRYPYVDRIYEERSRRIFPKHLIKFREEIPWERFYWRISKLIIELESKNRNNTELTFNICKHGRLMELKILAEAYSIVPDINGANLLARDGNLSILEFLETKGVLPDERGANWAAENRFILVLDWLKERNILPIFATAIDLALENGNIIFLDWCELQGHLPGHGSCAIAVENDQLKVLKWLVKRGILPTANDINTAVQYGNPEIREYLEQQHMLSFHRTGNEDDASFHMIINCRINQFGKTITINHELDYDIYEETVYFPTYKFTVSEQIGKLNKNDITLELIAHFRDDGTFDGTDDDNISVWNTDKNGPVKYWPTQLVEPNDALKQFSVQLYNKYVEYYKGNNHQLME